MTSPAVLKRYRKLRLRQVMGFILTGFTQQDIQHANNTTTSSLLNKQDFGRQILHDDFIYFSKWAQHFLSS